MALPADFPQPPADRESLKAALGWIFQVLSWLIARAAAGDEWWKAGETQPPTPLPPAWGARSAGQDQGTAHGPATHGAAGREASAHLPGPAPEAARQAESAAPTGQAAEPALPAPPRPPPRTILKEPAGPAPSPNCGAVRD
jgi:hypothetical protein